MSSTWAGSSCWQESPSPAAESEGSWGWVGSNSSLFKLFELLVVDLLDEELELLLLLLELVLWLRSRGGGRGGGGLPQSSSKELPSRLVASSSSSSTLLTLTTFSTSPASCSSETSGSCVGRFSLRRSWEENRMWESNSGSSWVSSCSANESNESICNAIRKNNWKQSIGKDSPEQVFNCLEPELVSTFTRHPVANYRPSWSIQTKVLWSTDSRRND